MNCEELENRLLLYASNELPDKEKSEVERLLQEDENARRFLNNLQKLTKTGSQINDPDLQKSFVHQALPAGNNFSQERSIPFASVAALVLLCFGMGSLVFLAQNTPGKKTIVQLPHNLKVEEPNIAKIEPKPTPKKIRAHRTRQKRNEPRKKRIRFIKERINGLKARLVR